MRLVFFIVAFILVVTTPYWVYLPFVFVGIILFPLYLEAVILGLTADALYGGAGTPLFGFPFGIIAALLVFFAQPVREHLRFNA